MLNLLIMVSSMISMRRAGSGEHAAIRRMYACDEIYERAIVAGKVRYCASRPFVYTLRGRALRETRIETPRGGAV